MCEGVACLAGRSARAAGVALAFMRPAWPGFRWRFVSAVIVHHAAVCRGMAAQRGGSELANGTGICYGSRNLPIPSRRCGLLSWMLELD